MKGACPCLTRSRRPFTAAGADARQAASVWGETHEALPWNRATAESATRRRLVASFVSDHETGRGADRTSAADGAATLVWFLETGAVDSRRYVIVNRLRRLRDGDEFATLPEDLRARIREIIADAER